MKLFLAAALGRLWLWLRLVALELLATTELGTSAPLVHWAAELLGVLLSAVLGAGCSPPVSQ